MKLGGLGMQFGTVDQTCFSPDGSRVATATRDGTVPLWNVERAEAIGPPVFHWRLRRVHSVQP